KGTYVRYPERKELFTAQEINELLVVEFYNR
ncbi:MAG: 30S ribosomal protein S4, partial [Solobacterium sp.]|nr:30S ribosomal protein S4 [Holdemanella biformis]MBD9216759.1 30S ribosomal protein S4 [Solobacterium sp.]